MHCVQCLCQWTSCHMFIDSSYRMWVWGIRKRDYTVPSPSRLSLPPPLPFCPPPCSQTPAPFPFQHEACALFFDVFLLFLYFVCYSFWCFQACISIHMVSATWGTCIQHIPLRQQSTASICNFTSPFIAHGISAEFECHV